MIPAKSAVGTRAGAETDQESEAAAQTAEEFVDHIVEINDWNSRYWLALNTVRNALDPYHEHRHVEINGRLLRPTGLKTDRMEMSLFPSTSLEEKRRKDLKPIAVGAIEAYPKRLDQNLSLPPDALVSILQM